MRPTRPSATALPPNPAAPRASGWTTIRRVAPYLWPPGETGIRARVVVSMILLLIAKIIAVGTPIFYKAAVDALAPAVPSAPWMLGLGAVGMTVAYGGARLINTGFQQLRDGIFAVVGQRALRQLAFETFTHIHRLSPVSYTHLTLPTNREV